MYGTLRYIVRSLVGIAASTMVLNAAGMSGTYVMTGTLYYKSKPLRNQLITMSDRDGRRSNDISFRTTESGAYWIVVHFWTLCPEGNYPADFDWNEAVSPRHLQFYWSNHVVTIKAHSRRFNMRVRYEPIGHALKGKAVFGNRRKIDQVCPVFYILGVDEAGNQKDVVQDIEFAPARAARINGHWHFKATGNPSFPGYLKD